MAIGRSADDDGIDIGPADRGIGTRAEVTIELLRCRSSCGFDGVGYGNEVRRALALTLTLAA